MHHPRIAFAAGYWGEGAVVCRAHEDCPGPVVDQEFGFFETWTHANAFANKLNEGLELSTEQANQIVRSALLARAEVLHAGFPDAADRTRRLQLALLTAKERRRPVELLLVEMDIAIGIYRSARLLRDRRVSQQALRRGRRLAEQVVVTAQKLGLAEADRDKLVNRYDLLQRELDAFGVSAMADEMA